MKGRVSLAGVSGGDGRAWIDGGGTMLSGLPNLQDKIFGCEREHAKPLSSVIAAAPRTWHELKAFCTLLANAGKPAGRKMARWRRSWSQQSRKEWYPWEGSESRGGLPKRLKWGVAKSASATL